MAYHIKLMNVDNDEVHLLVHGKPKYSTLKELANTLGGYFRKEGLRDLVVYIGIEELPSSLRGEATVIIRGSQQVIIRGDSKVLEELSDLKKRRLVIEIGDARRSCNAPFAILILTAGAFTMFIGTLNMPESYLRTSGFRGKSFIAVESLLNS